ncbi:MAG TPA: hypothetical protein DEG78_08160 [Rhodobacteraceae bacterium]|nr:hypothetical protein [Paracoccaceae bacterium]HBY13128.1 hypothetical protein [Paracoccaceae bacterium]HCC98261.1 hypothetical protein [Paracoccaceae bacterium]
MCLKINHQEEFAQKICAFDRFYVFNIGLLVALRWGAALIETWFWRNRQSKKIKKGTNGEIDHSNHQTV